MTKISRPIWNPMVDSFSIRNFRSFKSVEVKECSRVNIVVGGNGCGKTSLLEGIFLASGISPELAVRARGWRGLEAERMSGNQAEIWDALFADLFYRFDTTKPAIITLTSRSNEHRSVAVQMHKKGRVIPPPRNKPGAQPTILPFKSPVQFVYRLRGESEEIVEPLFDQGRLNFPPIRGEPLKISFFAANRTPPHMESTNQFSKLSQRFESEEFVAEFAKIYSHVRGISIELAGGAPTLFATIEHLPRKIPLTLASGGMTKLVAVLLAMSLQSGGVVLVDELENGFYHSHLPVIWRALLSFSRKYDCQLFVSTHSYECLASAAELARESPSEFRVLRAILKNGETTLTNFGGDRFAEAIEENIEIR